MRLGQFLLCKVYSYRNVSMGFTPFEHNVSGVPKTKSSSESFWVYIMGPLPGILIGLILFFIYFYNLNQSNEPSSFMVGIYNNVIDN